MRTMIIIGTVWIGLAFVNDIGSFERENDRLRTASCQLETLMKARGPPLLHLCRLLISLSTGQSAESQSPDLILSVTELQRRLNMLP